MLCYKYSITYIFKEVYIMNIKDLKYLKKQFKQDKSLLRINDIYSVFINGENREVLTTQFSYFNAMEEEIQDILLKNMKKILSGNIDVNVFEKEFNEEMLDDTEGSSKILKSMVKDNKNAFIEHCNAMVKKLLNTYTYDENTAVYFTRVTLLRKDTSYDFVICTINKAETPKQQVIYNYDEKAFEYKNRSEPIIKMASPIEGFMFPVFENDSIDFDKVLYYSSKSNNINTNFVFNVLNCDIKLTAKQEKTCFHNILNTVIGGKIKPIQLYNLYDNILKRYEQEEDEEYRTLSLSVLNAVLDEIDIKTVVDINEIYTKVLGNTNYQFNINKTEFSHPL